MLKVCRTMALFIVVFASLLRAQNTAREDEARENKMARPQDFGIGLELGLYNYHGDIMEGNTFTDGKSKWKLGGNLLIHYRLTTLFDSSASLNLLGRLGFYPLEASATKKFPYSFTDDVLGGDIALGLELFNSSSIRPYGFAGVGFATYNPKATLGTTDPLIVALWNTETKANDKSSLTIPFGAGIIWSITDNIDIFGQFHKNLTFTDNLDNWQSNIKDNWAAFSLGLKYFFGGEKERREVKPPAAPVVLDSDGDGCTDEDERNIYGTDPNNKDTDGDGLTDCDEVKIYHTNPLNKDTDGDGLTDGDEVLKYHTDPLNKDTDGDGCSDGDEVLKMHTDPLNKDTDGDGLTDCDEVNIYHTNPLIADTDGDGVNDGKEIANGTNPLKADVLKIEPEKGEQSFILEGIYFDFNKSTIKPESEETLTKAYNTLKAYPNIKVQIEGHTDKIGGTSYNQKLSESRAKAVVDWLIAKGIDPTRMTAKGFGKTRPIATNETEEGRAKNRRIEFKVLQ